MQIFKNIHFHIPGFSWIQSCHAPLRLMKIYAAAGNTEQQRLEPQRVITIIVVMNSIRAVFCAPCARTNESVCVCAVYFYATAQIYNTHAIKHMKCWFSLLSPATISTTCMVLNLLLCRYYERTSCLLARGGSRKILVSANCRVLICASCNYPAHYTRELLKTSPSRATNLPFTHSSKKSNNRTSRTNEGLFTPAKKITILNFCHRIAI